MSKHEIKYIRVNYQLIPLNFIFEKINNNTNLFQNRIVFSEQFIRSII